MPQDWPRLEALPLPLLWPCWLMLRLLRRSMKRREPDPPREAPKARRPGRPKTGQKTPWKALNISKATYYRRGLDKL